MEKANSVETTGVDLRTETRQLGAKEKTRRKKCKVRFGSREICLPAGRGENASKTCQNDLLGEVGIHTRVRN